MIRLCTSRTDSIQILRIEKKRPPIYPNIYRPLLASPRDSLLGAISITAEARAKLMPMPLPFSAKLENLGSMFKRKNVVLTRPGAREEAQDSSKRVEARTPPQPSHPSIRPSLVSSKPTTTTGSRSLDNVLVHGGVPVGSLTLVEEHGTTDFASSLLKSVCTQSVVESREGAPSKVVCLGIPDWLRALPSVAKERKRSSSKQSSQQTNERMKIAWRYAKYAQEDQAEDTTISNSFCRDVDFKSTLLPSPQHNEVTYVLGVSLDDLANKLAGVLQSIPSNTLVRIVAPSFLHPVLFRPESSDPQVLLPFFYQLKRLVSSRENTVAFVSLPLQLYPRTRSVVAGLELICDTCIELQPIETGDDKIHGLLHINRIAELTDRGEMVEQRYMWAFKLGRHQFEVTQFGIPVETVDTGVPDDKEKDKESW